MSDRRRAELARLAGGKVERVYRPATMEPPVEDASPAEVALFLAAVLETTRADINAASRAQEVGEDRRIALSRTVLRLNDEHLEDLKAQTERLLFDARDRPDDDGVWTTVLWATVDREDRRPVGRSNASKRDAKPSRRGRGKP